jgi:meso-butanediol dehydrogenase/(S,S)-butanediol dehydrogenase/diacetyl reductase
MMEEDDIQRMLAAHKERFGRLDVLMNNAGLGIGGLIEAAQTKKLDMQLGVNLRAVYLVTRDAIPMLKEAGKNGGGMIVNTASIAGKQGYEPLAHYLASKFAVVALTQAGARAFAKSKIRVNAICPGVVATDMWKLIDRGFKESGLTVRDNEAFETFAATDLLGRGSRPDDMAGVAMFLASSDSEFMTGQTLLVDGGIVLD